MKKGTRVILSLLVVVAMALGAVSSISCGEKKEAKKETEEEPEPRKDYQMYNWSTMKDGPYKDNVSYATSNDLLNWTDSGKVLAEHASVPGAVIKDGVIYIYFVDFSEDGLPEQLGMIKSTDDGSTWSERKILKVKGIGDKIIVDPAPFLLEDGRIRIYYLDFSQRPGPNDPTFKSKIYSAISKDGENFTQEDWVRFTHDDTFDPDVIKVGDEWNMYAGNVLMGTDLNRVILAVSSDGLNFQEEGVAFEGGSVPDVFLKDGTYYLYTAGIDIATSPDGRSFVSTGQSFHTSLGQVTADPSVIELGNGQYMMIFKFSEGGMPPEGDKPPPPPGREGTPPEEGTPPPPPE